MPDKRGSLCWPQRLDALTEESLWQWFQNIPTELELLSLSDAERVSLEGYYQSAGLLKSWRRPFFRHHYVTPLLLAVREIFKANPRPRILDLGCGTGTQSLLFALLGAEVVGLDMDDIALTVFKKRIELYEQQSGSSLNIRIHSGNVFEIDWSALGTFDAVYSLFAFNMMQPSSQLLQQIAPHLRSRAVLAVQDGNRRHFFNRVFRKRKSVASRDELQARLREVGFDEIRHIGGYAIPPQFWRVAPARVLGPVDRVLASADLLAVSYLHLARRGR